MGKPMRRIIIAVAGILLTAYLTGPKVEFHHAPECADKRPFEDPFKTGFVKTACTNY